MAVADVERPPPSRSDISPKNSPGSRTSTTTFAPSSPVTDSSTFPPLITYSTPPGSFSRKTVAPAVKRASFIKEATAARSSPSSVWKKGMPSRISGRADMIALLPGI